MPNRRMLMGLLLVTLVAAGIATWLLRGSTALPRLHAQGKPASPGAAQHANGDSGPLTGRAPASTSPQNQDPARVEVSQSSAADRRPCTLQVFVLSQPTEASERPDPTQPALIRTPVPFVDVTIELPALALRGVTARTDHRGIAKFTLLGGHGQQVLGEAGIGGRSQATLSAEQAITMSIVARTRVIATGRVIDSSNVGVPDADVVVLHWPFEAQGNPHRDAHQGKLWRVGRSGRDGSFHIPIGIGGCIGASHDQYASSAMYLLRPMSKRDGNAPIGLFELLLSRGATTITGTVRDGHGHPVFGAQIEVRSSMAAPAAAELVGPPGRARSDAAGAFRITGLPAGDVRWSARAANCGWREGHANLDSRDYQLHIELPLPASIEGVVVDKLSGKPVARATVSAGTTGSLCYQSTQSADDGSYRLDDLGSGLIEVRARLKQQQATTRLQLLPEHVVPWHAELALPTDGLMLTGIVLDADGQSLSNWTVVVRQQGHADIPPINSGEDGRFAVPVAMGSGLDVRCYAPGRHATSFADAMRRNAVAGQEVKLVVSQQETTTIVGTIVANQGAGVPATIDCWHDERSEWARYTADADGHFVIADAPVGTVNLIIKHPVHVTYKSGELLLEANTPHDIGTVHMLLGGGLYGTVLGAAGTPPPDYELLLLIENPRQQMAAEYVGGGYRFSKVPAGTHTLLVQGDQIAGAAYQITFEAGVDLPRDLELQAGVQCRIRVQVAAGGGQQVTLALTVKGTHGTTAGMRWFATGNVQRDRATEPGFALFDTFMAPGEYEAIAYTPEGYVARTAVTYTSNGATPFVMQLLPQ